MSKELVISATPHETRVAILEDGHLCEIYIEREKEFALVGSIYKGRVTRVLPGMQSAFVDIGRDTDAFLYVSDFLENLEEYDNAVPGEGVKPTAQVAAPSASPSAPIPFAAPASAPPRQAPPVRHHLEVLPGEHIAKAESGGASEIAGADFSESSQPEPGNFAPVASESHAPLTDVEPGDPPQPKDNSTPALNPPAHMQRHSGAPRRERGFTGSDRGGFGRSDRGDRGGRDRGGDRGPRRSSGGGSGSSSGGGGRFRGRGGRDRQGGARDLPSSKYASPQGGDRGDRGDRGPRREHGGGFRGPAPVRRSEPSGPAPTGENLEPIILPGESLAKYKERPAGGSSVGSPGTELEFAL